MPGLGRLTIEQLPAQSDFVNKTILAPQPFIRYNEEVLSSEEDGFIQYVGRKKSIGWREATEQFTNWCNDTKAILQQNGQFYLAYAGTFFQKGQQISFIQASLPAVFFPPAPAERVVHPEAAHNMLVGDKETTTAQMTEYLAGDTVEKKRWWIAALIVALVALALIAWHYSTLSASQSVTGVNTSIHAVDMPVLHQIVP